jgi:Na+-driven multidrug efflux pump
VVGISLKVGPVGVFGAITMAEILIAIIGILWFRKGSWKTVKV